ncbi:MAG: PQQ-binding-like beta-propeller repeat protein [Planctomycetota bacterium]
MTTRTSSRIAFAGACCLSLTAATALSSSDDWPQWGKDITNNMAAGETGIPAEWNCGEFVGGSDEIDLSTAKNVKWVAKLGSQSYGNPTISNGLVFVGTNNDAPRDSRFKGDMSCVYCIDEETGEYLWQLITPKLGAGKVSDWEYLGMCSSVCVDGDKGYVVTNQCEVVCFDVNGLKNGNQGVQDEGQRMAGRGKKPVEVLPHDADILWAFNMTDECGVFPHNVTSSSVLVVGDKVWASTSNGVDYGHIDMPNPQAPCLIVLDKNTGELIAEEQIGLSERTMHCNWSSPGYLMSEAPDGTKMEQCIFGGPDGFCYGFSPEFGKDEDGYGILEELWRYDVNEKGYRFKEDGSPQKYATRGGPSEIIASPVIYKNRVYTMIGQDPEHGTGVGNLACIDPTKTGDISESGKIWEFSDVGRGISTPSIGDDLLYAADYAGFVYCLDAMTGEEYWRFDTKGHIWGSTLLVDGKVYIGNEDGFVTVLEHGKEKKMLGEVDMIAPVYSSPVAANGVLYIATQTHLFAIAQEEGGDK